MTITSSDLVDLQEGDAINLALGPGGGYVVVFRFRARNIDLDLPWTMRVSVAWRGIELSGAPKRPLRFEPADRGGAESQPFALPLRLCTLRSASDSCPGHPQVVGDDIRLIDQLSDGLGTFAGGQVNVHVACLDYGGGLFCPGDCDASLCADGGPPLDAG